jgi:hypothetical protein
MCMCIRAQLSVFHYKILIDFWNFVRVVPSVQVGHRMRATVLSTIILLWTKPNQFYLKKQVQPRSKYSTFRL